MIEKNEDVEVEFQDQPPSWLEKPGRTSTNNSLEEGKGLLERPKIKSPEKGKPSKLDAAKPLSRGKSLAEGREKEQS